MELRLPKLGEGADTGVVVNILVKEGDTIAQGQTILELENEKAVAPIPATAGGVVERIRVKEGDQIGVGAVLISLKSGEAAPPKIEQKIGNQLAGAVIGDLSTSIRVDHGDVTGAVHMLRLAVAPEGEDRWMLKQPQLIR